MYMMYLCIVVSLILSSSSTCENKWCTDIYFTAICVTRHYHSDWSKVTQHALTLGSSDHVEPDPLVPAKTGEPAHTAFQ